MPVPVQVWPLLQPSGCGWLASHAPPVEVPFTQWPFSLHFRPAPQAESSAHFTVQIRSCESEQTVDEPVPPPQSASVAHWQNDSDGVPLTSMVPQVFAVLGQSEPLVHLVTQTFANGWQI